ncbi:MAG: TetR/AcrR family transcriptional regulator [Coriobacteriia bacterium]|nr:TetR/AcrR family transcriptional regulator [Coriobacteriia bacterium]
MNKAFLELPEKRQQAILNTAYEEFGANGYDRASTNAIVSAAGISKGTLFNYFGSKIELFQTLVATALELVKTTYISQLDHDLRDFLEKYRQATQVKYHAYHTHPHEFNFFGGVFLYESNEPAVRKAAKRMEQIRVDAEAYFRQNNDTSLFLAGLDPPQAIRLMQYCLDGYERDMMRDLRGHTLAADKSEALWEDFYRFLDQLRSVFYRKGA